MLFTTRFNARFKKCTTHAKSIDLPLNVIDHSQNTKVDHFALLKEEEKQNKLNVFKSFSNLNLVLKLHTLFSIILMIK